ncbi:MAG: hypothetical protein IPK42_10775 [Betaproteobacteria bacterium]|nr:hypothetical protein [Betaproteobacteria bacterium]
MEKIPLSSIRVQFPMYGDFTDDQLLSAVRKKYYADIPMGKFASMIDYDTERERLQKETTDEMSLLDQIRAGLGKSMFDVARGAGQLVGAVSRDDVAESRKLDAGLMKTGGGITGNVLGNVAMIAPTALIPGAGSLVGGAALGGALGFLQPSESGSETLFNTGLGVAGGAAVPLAQRGWKAGRAMLEPFYDKGKEAIVGRALNAAAGSDAAAVRQRLSDAAAPFVGPSRGMPRTTMGELVPGSLPTVGQAAQNPGVAALERTATATNPSVTNAVTAMLGNQNTARVSLLDDLAGAGGARDFFAADRTAVGDRLYDAARRLGVNAQNMTPAELQNIANFSKRVPDEVLSRAKLLAQISGEEMTDATSLQGMHWIKRSIDDLIGSASRAGNTDLKRAYTGLKTDLLKGMDNMSPAYAQARKTFEQMSRPINQMDVAQAISDQSVNKLTGTLQPAAYARAFSDKTAARTLGMPGATLEKTMEPAQMNALDSILLDVQRSTAAQNVGRGPGSDTVQKLAYSNILDNAGVPGLLRDLKPVQAIGGLLGRASDAAYGRANRELSEMLAEIMLDPGKAAQVMAQATPAQRTILQKMLEKTSSGLLLSLPSSANAQ